MLDPHLHEDAPAVTPKTLRQFAALSVIVFGSLGAWQAYVKHHVPAAGILAAVAIGLGAVGLSRPEAIRLVFTALMAVATPIGLIVSRVLLAVLFYLVFTPIGLMFRLFGRDALQVRRRARASDWVVKPPTTDLRSYTRQS